MMRIRRFRHRVSRPLLARAMRDMSRRLGGGLVGPALVAPAGPQGSSAAPAMSLR